MERPQSIIDIMNRSPELTTAEAIEVQEQQLSSYRSGLSLMLGISIDDIHQMPAEQLSELINLAEQEQAA